jgi:hypothetical protein
MSEATNAIDALLTLRRAAHALTFARPRAITNLYDAVLKPTGLGATHGILLMAIAMVGTPTISHLAEAWRWIEQLLGAS